MDSDERICKESYELNMTISKQIWKYLETSVRPSYILTICMEFVED